MSRPLRLLLTSLTVIVLSLGIAVGAVGTASAATKTCKVSTPLNQRPVLRRGDTGSCVTVAQGLLANYKAYNSTFDVDFGPKTEAAVKQVQRDNNLTADGIIGPKTWPVLAKKSPATQKALKNTSTNRTTRTTSTTRRISLPTGCPKTADRSICIDKTSGTQAKMYHVEGNRAIETYTVRVDGDNTQTGDYDVVEKSNNSNLRYALYFNNEDSAIYYSNSSTRSNADCNGCVAISNQDTARRLYNWASEGTWVTIIE